MTAVVPVLLRTTLSQRAVPAPLHCCRLIAVFTTVERYAVVKVLAASCCAVTSLRYGYVASHCTLGNFFWNCLTFLKIYFSGVSRSATLSLTTPSHCTLLNFFANCRNFFHIFSWWASYWWFFQSHCLSLYIVEFFCELPEVFFIYFLGEYLFGDFSNHSVFYCTLLNFFANCSLYLKIYFLDGTSCPAECSRSHDRPCPCSAAQTTLSQRAVPASLLCCPVVCRM